MFILQNDIFGASRVDVKFKVGYVCFFHILDQTLNRFSAKECDGSDAKTR